MIAYSDFRLLLTSAASFDTLDAYIIAHKDSIDRTEKALVLLKAMWEMAHDGLTIKSIAAACDRSVRSIAMEYGISTRTLENWASGTNAPPEWVLPTLAYAVLSDYVENLK